MAKGRIHGGRSQDGARNLTDRGGDVKGGAEEMKTQGDTEGLEGKGRAAG